jgi:hypothetical protein
MKTKAFIVLAMWLLSVCGLNAECVKLEKELTYDQHTLPDTYPYEQGTREFQWEKIKEKLAQTDVLRAEQSDQWVVLQNKSNVHGQPTATEEHRTDEYKIITDKYGVERYQAIPLFLQEDLETPERYAYDGSLAKIIGQQDNFVIATATTFEGEYLIPTEHIHAIEGSPEFAKVIVVDRNNQNISTYEKVGDTWKIRSMNPCTTGAHHPPMQKPTPLGLFVLQEKKAKMFYYVDGTTEIGGYAPWANRFCSGAYIHGVPVNLPHTEIIEFSSTLGTIPRSHMCVRNAASHSKFIYDNFSVDETLVYVIE